MLNLDRSLGMDDNSVCARKSHGTSAPSFVAMPPYLRCMANPTLSSFTTARVSACFSIVIGSSPPLPRARAPNLPGIVQILMTDLQALRLPVSHDTGAGTSAVFFILPAQVFRMDSIVPF